MSRIKPQSPGFFKGVRLRLTIALPAIFILLTFGSGVLAINLSKLRIFDPFGRLRVPPFHLNQVYLWIGGYALLSGVIGYVFAHFLLVKPVKKSLETIEDLLPESLSPSAGAETETTLLAQTLSTLYPALGKWKMTQSILDAFQGGLLWIGIDQTILFGNRKGFEIFNYNPVIPKGKEPRITLPDVLKGIENPQPLIEIVQSGLENKRYVASKVIDLVPKQGIPKKIGVTSSPVSPKEQFEGLLLSFRELSEIRRLQRDLDRLNRLSAIGRLASGLVHEIRNPLGSIMGLLEILKREPVPEKEEAREIIERIYRAGARIQNLLTEVLDFAGPSDVTIQPISLPVLLDQALHESRASFLKKSFHLTKNYQQESEEGKILADGEKLKQAFVNILRNAMEAVDVGGEIRVSIRRDLENHWAVFIFNSGSHIPEEAKEKIFDPFYTTKSRGTGLGLPIARELITLQGGTLSFQNEPGGGVVFIIQFQGVA